MIVKTKEELHRLLWRAEAEGRILPQIPEENYEFCKLLLGRSFSRVIEIGVGRASTPVWSMLLEKGGLIVGIDPDRRTCGWITKPPFCIDESQFVFLHGRSQNAMIIDKVSTYFDEGSVDMLFIDGIHSYIRPEFKPPSGVKPDFDNYKKFVKPGGLIVLHDIDLAPEGFEDEFRGPRQLFEELQGAGCEGVEIGGSSLGYGVIYMPESGEIE